MPASEGTSENKQIVAIADQVHYNELYSNWLPGSPVIRLRGRIKHPLMIDSKFLPPECPLKVRMKLHKAGQLFQCEANNLPQVKMLDAYFLDTTFKMSSELANSFTREIFKNNSQIVLPFTRPVTSEVELPKSKSVYLSKVLQGTLPRRMAVYFVKNRAWKAESSAHNPYDYPYLGITRFRIHYGNKTWPTREGYEVLDMPDAAHPRPYTDGEMEELIN